MRRPALIALIASAAAAVAPGPAAAAGPQLVEARSAKFPDRTWVLTLPARRDIDARDVQLRENGRVVDGLHVVPGDEAGASAFGVVLAIDASESMHGAAIADAMEAARAFAARREPNQQLGLVLFSREHRTVLPLTTDQRRIDAALATVPSLSKGTRVYDAGAAAVDLLSSSGVKAGSVVVLSDGADVGSTISAEALGRTAQRNRVRVFTVGLESPSFSPSTLSGIADATGGAYSQASSTAQLRDIYAALGDQLSREYLVSYRSPATLGTTVDVRAQIEGIGEAVASYDVPALQGAVAPTVSDNSALTPGLFALALLFLALVGVCAALLLRRPRQSVPDRISAYVMPHRPALLDDQPVIQRASPLSRIVEHLMERARWWPRLVQDVQLADVGMSAPQLVAITTLGTLTMVWTFAALGRPVAAVLLALTPLVVRAVISVRTARVRRAFAEQLPDNLQVVASAMRAGHSFEGGLAVAAEDAAEPMRTELRRVVSDERLGIPLDQAMAAVAERMQSKEFEQVGLILMAQREAGGNVAELLDRTVESLRHRADLRRLVSSLTAQGRFSGGIVTALPFAVALFLSVVQPGYFDPMLDSSVGRVLIGIALAMMVLAWAVIRKVIDVKV